MQPFSISDWLVHPLKKQDLRKTHFERGILELLTEIVIQEPMLKLINGPTSLVGKLVEPPPNEEGTTDVIALNSGLATLTSFQASDLFAFAMQLLNPPAKATHLLSVLR